MRSTVLKVIQKSLHGTPSDQLADIEGRIQAERANVDGARGELEQLEQQRRVADDFDAATALDGRIARLRWSIERAEVLLPQLEAERDAALADRRREQLARHIAATGKIYPRLRKAIEAAAAVQGEAIAARQAAIGELGEGVVQRNIPALAFMGLILPDLVEIWGKEMDRVYAAPQPIPAITSARPAAPARRAPTVDPGRSSPVGLNDPWPPNNRVSRPLRRDTEAREGERLIAFMRSGVEIDGFHALAGDVISLPNETARELVKSGAADYATGVAE